MKFDTPAEWYQYCDLINAAVKTRFDIEVNARPSAKFDTVVWTFPGYVMPALCREIGEWMSGFAAGYMVRK